ncbi:Outer membrane protein TolC [Desulfocicer vacuolatum DSM 3385]|uniref:Outer membrane protein TolC n=1 Tax=Desulfocicer vacuolatum DSM 3385 TaxID=1121400 RepID=A0A1W2CC42_9BACT|nr:TolC family protein [Desulfocicer vacuolatum]SMC82646.1 Outer membrane protein TolC [Desulfocicer vacuolatum DSM 3385]
MNKVNKNILIFIPVVLMLALIASRLFAGELDGSTSVDDLLTKEVSLDQVLHYATENNPSIQVEVETWRTVVEKYRVATAYPDPQLMVTWFPSPIETRLGPQEWNATLSQKIPFPGKLSTSGEVVKTEAAMAKLATDARVRSIRAKVAKSFHELLYIQKAKKIARQNAILLGQLSQMAQAAHADDRTALMDLLKAQSQEGQLQYDILLLEELGHTEKTILNTLLNRSPDTGLGALQDVEMVPLSCSLTTLYRLADANQEGIRISDLKIEKARLDAAFSEYSGKPDLKLGLFYAAIGEPDVASPPKDAGDDAVGIQFGVNIPLWSGKNQGRINMARAGIARQKAMKSKIVNQTHSTIRALFFKLNNSQRLVALYRDNMLPQALKALEFSQEWFQQGQGSFSDVVEAQAAVYNFQLSLARARADHGGALAELERLVGGFDQCLDSSRMVPGKSAKEAGDG